MLDKAQDSLTVELNGRNLTSLEIEKNKNRLITLPIEASMLVAGRNTLRLGGSLFLQSDAANECQIWNDPARWIEFLPISVLHIELEPKDNTANLENALSLFHNPIQSFLPPEQQIKTLVVFPDLPTADDLSAITTLGYAFGTSSRLAEPWTPEVIYFKDFNPTKVSDHNLIFINVFPNPLTGLQPTNKGYLLVQTSPWNSKRAMMVVADVSRFDDFSPSQILLNPTRDALLQGNRLFVEKPKVIPAVPTLQRFMTFESLGYPDRTTSGIGTQDITYRIFVPYDNTITSMRMDLQLAHSPDLNTNASRFTIYLNGFSIAGIVPNKGNASDALIPVNIPVARFRPGINYLRLSFLLLPNKTNCQYSPDQIWVTVSNKTTLEAATAPALRTSILNDFPMPFSDNPSGLFVVPNHPEPALLSKIAGFATSLGSVAMDTTRAPRMATENEFARTMALDKYVMVFGEYKKSPLLQDVNDYLPQPFAADGMTLATGYGVYDTDDNQPTSLGVIQVMHSPWNAQGGIAYVVSGTTPEGMTQSLNFITNAKNWPKFKETLLLLGTDGKSATVTDPELLSVDTWKLERVGQIPIVGAQLQNIRPDDLVPAVVSIIAAFLLLIVLLVILRIHAKGIKG